MGRKDKDKKDKKDKGKKSVIKPIGGRLRRLDVEHDEKGNEIHVFTPGDPMPKAGGGRIKIAGYKAGGRVKKSIDGIARKGKTKARHR